MREPRLSATNRRPLMLGALALFVGLGGGAGIHAMPASAATLAVSNCNDSGPGSLRQAVADAASGDTIAVTPFGCSTIALTTGAIDVGGDIGIAGPGASELTLTGNSTSSAFIVDATGSLSISGLAIDRTVGGAIVNNGGSLALSGSTIFDRGSIETEGVRNVGGSATITNSRFLGVAGSYCCSAIANMSGGNLLVANSVISDHDTVHEAGGISNYTGSTLKVVNTLVRDNSSGRIGGGIANYGDADIVNTTVTGNGCSSVGGGVFNEGTMTITNSTVADNGASAGGGIANEGNLTIKNSAISGNRAGGGGGLANESGATLSVQHSEVTQNEAQFGGAVSNSGDFTVMFSSFHSNPDSSTDIYPGFFNESPGGTVTVTKSSFS